MSQHSAHAQVWNLVCSLETACVQTDTGRGCLLLNERRAAGTLEICSIVFLMAICRVYTLNII